MGKLLIFHGTTVASSLVFLEGLAEFLAARGWRVGVWSSPGERLVAMAQRERCLAFPINISRRISIAADLVALTSLAWLFFNTKADVVHAHTPKGGLIGMLAAAMAGVPVRLYHVHGFPFETQKGWRRIVLLCCDRLACGLASGVFGVSRAVRDQALRQRLCRRGKFTVLLNGSIGGVDATRRFNRVAVEREYGMGLRSFVRFPEGVSIVTFVGRLAKDKGIDDLAAIWEDLRDTAGIRLLIVGGEDARDSVDASTLKLLSDDSRVQMTGEVSDVRPYLYYSDVLIFPSYREGFGNVVIEAAAMSVPAVAYDIPACRESVRHGETGVLVANGDRHALGQALRRYLEDAGLRRAHGAAARLRVLRDFVPGALWGALCDEYSVLCRVAGIGNREI